MEKEEPKKVRTRIVPQNQGDAMRELLMQK